MQRGGAGAPQGDANREELAALRREAEALLEGHKLFHWPLEFPEVFLEEAQPIDVGGQQALDGFGEVIGPLFGALEQQPLAQDGLGFAAIVGNPPFQGGKLITGTLGVPYRDYLVEYLAHGTRGHADLCAYFFLRMGNALQKTGQFGLIATNTIAQGDTREVGLDQLIDTGFTIPRAVPSRPWPGLASVEVAHVYVRRGEWQSQFVLDDEIVGTISSLLTATGTTKGKPCQLLQNKGKSFNGSYVLGMGFVLDSEQAQFLIEKDKRNRDVLFPYLNGEDLNSRYDQSSSRWVINFYDWTLERAETYPDLMKVVQEKVKPDRTRLNEKDEFALRKPLPQRWWQYADRRPALYATIANMERVLVVAATSRTLAFVFSKTGTVFSHATYVFALDKGQQFAVMQSAFHEVWAREYASSMKGDLRYTPSDVFETFPFPASFADLDTIGETYHAHRQSVMLQIQEGLTKTYNRFHNLKEHSTDIAELRRLHVEMNHAVAAAYGWGDLDLGHGFHETKQGLRYTISEAARRTVLDRLLALNHQRYAEEIALGLHDKGAKKSQKGIRKSIKRSPNSPGTPQLILDIGELQPIEPVEK
ncbi:MAG: hypothetical protein HC828_08135 [Blastochloris sp.]|nr:hypothetical protein [Blastochloris sp.]